MSIDVKCKINKEVYVNYSNEFRVLGCKPIGHCNMELDNWGGFSIAGNNLLGYKVGNIVEITIRPNQNAKRKASYVLVGLTGLDIDAGTIVVNVNKEYSILCTMMDEKQAKHVHDAYPHFVQMVLRGEEEQLDYKKIYNVGKVRIEEYINKVKANCNTILYFPTCNEIGVTNNEEIAKLMEIYQTTDLLKQSFDENPYHIYCDTLKWSFNKSDREVLKRKPELIDSYNRCMYGCIDLLEQNEEEGNTRIEAEVLEYMAEDVIPEAKEHISSVVNGCDFIYHDEKTGYSSLKSTFLAEQTIADHIKHRLEAPNLFTDKYTMSTPDFEQFREVDGFKCTDEQMQILYNVWEKNISVLMGNAGSGKSSSTKALIRMLEAVGVDYTLLAPTGIAAKVLSKATGRRTSTIHRFLACTLKENEDKEACVNYEGVVVVDESSMISVHLMSKLLKYVGRNCKLVFVCDPAQLASISCGNFITNVINSGVVPVASLTKIFRYSSSGLITVATDTRNGSVEHLEENCSDYEFIPISDNPVEQVVEEYIKLLSEYHKEDIMILSPFNKGLAGSWVINNAIQSNLNDHEFTGVGYEDAQRGGEVQFKIGDRVINTHNNYNNPAMEMTEEGFEPTTSISIMNGDIGYVREVIHTEDKGDGLIVEFDNGYGSFIGKDLRNLMLGYCISTHRAQGSGSDAVIFLADRTHSRMLSRNLCYVAITRSKKKLVVISDKDVIHDALKVEEQNERDTWLCDMLKEISE